MPVPLSARPDVIPRCSGILKIPLTSISITGPHIILIIPGFLAGFISALFGIGSGIIIVSTMILFFGLKSHEAIVISLSVVAPTTLAGAFFHKKFSNINLYAIKYLVPAALCGAILGTVFASSLDSFTLRKIFGIFLISAIPAALCVPVFVYITSLFLYPYTHKSPHTRLSPCNRSSNRL